MIITGLDLSLTGTGVVIIDGEKIVRQDLIKTKPSGDKPEDELRRMMKILIQITFKGLVVIEGLSMGMTKTTSLVQLAGLNYLVRYKCHQMGIPFIVVPPTMLKKFITGKGNIQKDVMLVETYRQYGVLFHDNNLCDAYGLAKIGEAVKVKNKKLTKPQKEVVEIIKEQL